MSRTPGQASRATEPGTRRPARKTWGRRARARRAGRAGLRGGGACFGRGGRGAAQTARGVSRPRAAGRRAYARERVLKRRLRPRAGKAALSDRYPFGFHGRRRKGRKKWNGPPLLKMGEPATLGGKGVSASWGLGFGVGDSPHPPPPESGIGGPRGEEGWAPPCAGKEG